MTNNYRLLILSLLIIINFKPAFGCPAFLPDEFMVGSDFDSRNIGPALTEGDGVTYYFLKGIAWGNVVGDVYVYYEDDKKQNKKLWKKIEFKPTDSAADQEYILKETTANLKKNHLSPFYMRYNDDEIDLFKIANRYNIEPKKFESFSVKYDLFSLGPQLDNHSKLLAKKYEVVWVSTSRFGCASRSGAPFFEVPNEMSFFNFIHRNINWQAPTHSITVAIQSVVDGKVNIDFMDGKLYHESWKDKELRQDMPNLSRKLLNCTPESGESLKVTGGSLSTSFSGGNQWRVWIDPFTDDAGIETDHRDYSRADNFDIKYRIRSKDDTQYTLLSEDIDRGSFGDGGVYSILSVSIKVDRVSGRYVKTTKIQNNNTSNAIMSSLVETGACVYSGIKTDQAKATKF